MTLREAKKIAKELGANVSTKRRTGEVVFSYPGMKSITHNNRRNDASMALHIFIKRLREG
jgi:hypothetical protein